MFTEELIGGKRCFMAVQGTGGPLLIQPVDDHDQAGLDEEWERILSLTDGRPVTLAAFSITDWNRELSPWPAEPVFGQVPFGAGAADTLQFILGSLIPALEGRRGAAFPACFLGGYSLAGLFALWAGYQSSRFDGIAAVSPSVWFPGWMEHAEKHVSQASWVYLSLGDKEEKARNPVMARVGDCIRRQAALLRDDEGVTASTLEWNAGNHFRDAALRTAKGFAWVLNRENEDRIAGEKQRLRKACTAAAAGLSPALRSQASERITQAVLRFPAYLQAEKIFVYLSLPQEPDTHRLIAHALASGKQVYVPKCLPGGGMQALRLEDLAALRPGPFGIPEPTPDAEEADRLDLVIVPCVAASLKGQRLGHGKGYYDRFLARHPVSTLCLCFESLLQPQLPVTRQDVTMDTLATENGIFPCK